MLVSRMRRAGWMVTAKESKWLSSEQGNRNIPGGWLVARARKKPSGDEAVFHPSEVDTVSAFGRRDF